MLTPKDIEKLTELARIDVSDAEKEQLAHDLDGILGYVSLIKSLTEEKGAPESDPELLVNVHLREDSEPHESGKYTKDIMDEVPAIEKGYVKVRKIL